MSKKITCALCCLLFLFVSSGNSQTCQPPEIVANAKAANIFSPEQEMILGDLTFESMSGEIRFVRDEEILAYVNAVGARLVKHLPPIGLQYKFHVIDLPEANAFNIPGGHVFLSRKLIAFAANEDELAGVMAHELGHATVRHGAVDMTEMFKKILNVTALGDRKDITEKYNLLIENARTKRISRKSGHENAQQLEADKIGLFSMVAAGYDPAAFTSFFDRLTESEGKTGSWFSDIFGNTRPEQKRLREMIKLSEQLPQSCREGRGAKTNDAFLRWQAEVVSYREQGRKEELSGLIWKKELSPKLRSDVTHLLFSPDGKYLLAQDDFAITVIQRAPLEVLFQIPAEEAREASFTPDGKEIVFTTENLRYERWSIPLKEPLQIRELVLSRDCWESRLSPDGNYLACVDTSTKINILETKTGRKLFELKDFYPLSGFEYIFWLSRSRSDDPNKTNFFRIEFSPDSRHVLFSRSDRFRFRITFDMMQVAGSENTALGVDLTTLKKIEVGGDLKTLTSRPFIFLDGQRIIGIPSPKIDESGVFSFPSGKRLQKFPFGAQVIKRTGIGDYLIIKPIANGMLGFYDIKKGAILSGFNKADATIWNNIIAYESAAGKILLQTVKYNETEKKFDAIETQTIEIPVSSLGNLQTVAISDNFKYMALSSKTRGGVWDLETGGRKVFVRGFNSAIITPNGTTVSDFPKFFDTPQSLVYMNPADGAITPIGEIAGKGSRQYGRFILTRTSLKETNKTEKEKKAETDRAALDADESSQISLRREVRFELNDIVQNKMIWSRDFPKEVPRYSFDEYSGRLIFYWELGSDVGKAKLKESSELRAKADALLGDKTDDYLVEVIDAFAQKTVGWLLLETGKGSFYVGAGLSEGDWLMLYDTEDRVLVYSLKTGELRHRFFGSRAALNPSGNQIAVENIPGNIAVYNLETGERAGNFIINGRTVFVRFNLQGDKLFVFSDTQSAYAFDLAKIVVPKK